MADSAHRCLEATVTTVTELVKWNELSVSSAVVYIGSLDKKDNTGDNT